MSVKPDSDLTLGQPALYVFARDLRERFAGEIVLQVALGDDGEAAIIAGLLVFNAALGLFQESRAQGTLAALKSRLALSASVRRDNVWKTVPAAELVPDDVVKLSLGGVVAADVQLTEGEVLFDQSTLTGESVPNRSGRGRANLCRGVGMARRGGRKGHGNRSAH
jgi:H+-transporting ATPase